jgi:hypothetical protein
MNFRHQPKTGASGVALLHSTPQIRKVSVMPEFHIVAVLLGSGGLLYGVGHVIGSLWRVWMSA